MLLPSLQDAPVEVTGPEIGKFLFIRMFKLQFSFVQTFIHVKHCYSINASLMSILNQYIRIHYIQIAFIFCDVQLSIKKF